MGKQRMEVIVSVEMDFDDALQCAEDCTVDSAVDSNEQTARRAFEAALKKIKASGSIDISTRNLVVCGDTWDY